MRNYGQHNAIMAGLRLADGDYIILIDDDYQHPPKEIPKILSKIKEGMMFATQIIKIILQ